MGGVHGVLCPCRCRTPRNRDRLECESPQPQERRTAMKGTRHSEEQIIAILKQGEAGLTTAELCRQHGISEQTYYRWKAKYGGTGKGEDERMKQMGDANQEPKGVGNARELGI